MRNERHMRSQIRLTVGDGVLLVLVVLLAGLLFFLLPGWVISGGSQLEIRSGNKIVGRYPLERDQRIEVPGLMGTTAVTVKGRRAHIDSSPCAHKTCCAMGTVGHEGGVLVCAPNEVIVTVGREKNDHLDAVSR
jgi:hypothetical protein